MKYKIILADPPWRYEHPPMGATNRSIENHYPTMKLNEIKDLIYSFPFEFDKNSVLFLWATTPKLLESLELRNKRK